MTQMTNTLFVRIIDQPIAEKYGLDKAFDYPVFCVDVIDTDEGIVTNLMISNREGKLIWVPTDVVRRSQRSFSKPSKTLGGKYVGGAV